LPFFGIHISEVITCFSRQPLFGYKTMVFSTVGIAALSAAVWAHRGIPVSAKERPHAEPGDTMAARRR
jgi:heme/copper-type cytochrome/quinol oxidase subunit 1